MEKAKELIVEALKIEEENLGKDHVNLAYDMANLAAVYQFLEKYEEADPLFQKVIELKEKRREDKRESELVKALNDYANFLSNYFQKEGWQEKTTELKERARKIQIDIRKREKR